MSYVDAIKIGDTIHVVERRNGKRIFQKKPAKYVFYVKKKGGPYTSIYGDPLVKFETNSFKTYLKESNAVDPKSRFEHDIDPVTRFLETNYLDDPAPELHVAFFDIEVNFDPLRGYSRPEDPFNAVTSISVHQSWTDELWCFTIKPPTLSFDEAQEICDKFENTILCKTEEELFNRFFKCIDDADVLSGWNSTTFDIPYIVKRLEFISSKEKTKDFCLWNQYPKKRTFEMYGREQLSYNLVGRVHLDYLDLYKKNTYHQMHSYKLDNVAEYEVKEKKVSYDGSLDKLYKEDYELFIKYSRQDSLLLKKIDDSLKFIDLANQLAHENTVTLSKTLGSVALIEQAINIEIHKRGLIAPSRKKSSGDDKSVAGAFVANPKKGMHDWVGSIDINSLYPSVIRSLNISPETIVGQIDLYRTEAIIERFLAENKNATLTDAWAQFFAVKEFDMIKDKVGDPITVTLEDGDLVTLPAGAWGDEIFNDDSNLCISANGTIFRTDIEGIIPSLLSRWYSERIELQAKKKEASKELEVAEKNNASEDEIEKIKAKISFYDKRQLIKKILLNSLYGALLNSHCRYFDQRMGQSVTLTGRCITRHMIAKMNESFTGVYDHEGKCSIYGDTDSVTADTIINTNYGKKTIEELFHSCLIKWNNNDKEYSVDEKIKVKTYDSNDKESFDANIDYVYRHKVSKRKYQIVDEDGNSIIVTEDHSIMVERDGELIEVSPLDINLKTDILITIEKND